MIHRKQKIFFPESTKKYVKLQCNSDTTFYQDPPELRTLDHIFRNTQPKNVLDLGSGIGRISVFLKNRFCWRDTNFHLYDGDSGKKQIAGYSKNSKHKFYNSLAATKAYCLANGIREKHLFCINAEKISLKSVTGPFDLCYSFKSFGFHWPCLPQIRVLYKKTVPNAILLFEVRRGIALQEYEVLLKDQFEVLDWVPERDAHILVLQRV